ncbi:MAG: septum formation inhibitor Maf [Syntrophomonadaceae bacterium]|nr:septum formation inhibitor Maf [Syntrophomonadaceae bacterium]
MKRIILASQSPRRKSLLEQLDIHFECCPANIDEEFQPGETAREAARRIAWNKAEDVRKKAKNALIIAADTMVVCNGEILGKPDDVRDAFCKLSKLRGREHEVITAVCVMDAESGLCEVQDEITRVWFRDVKDEEIRAYIMTGEPMDKAGAYGIQGLGAVFIDRIEGCYFNVVGLPLKNLYSMLQRQGVRLLER